MEYRGAVGKHRDQAPGLSAACCCGAGHPAEGARYIYLQRRCAT
jgi:hypothetical protein